MCYFREEEIFVREFFYSEIESAKAMLAFIKTFKKYYPNLKVATPQGSNFNFLFPNQLKVEKKENPFILGRILNVKNILSYLNIKGTAFNIKVRDNILDENNGVFSIEEDGNVEKIDNIDGWNIDIDIMDLATLVSGYISIDNLVEFEKIRVNNIDLKILSNIFKKQKNYIQEFQ